MEKELLIKHIKDGLSTRRIAELTGKGQTTVRYWLKKYDLKTSPARGFGYRKRKNINISENKCFVCGKVCQKRSGLICQACRVKIRRHCAKISAIKYLGGKCCRCGYNKDISALEFHHLDSSKKEFQISSCADKSWDRLKSELDKCEILCSNCHRIEHSNRNNKAFLEAVLSYKGMFRIIE